MFYKKNTLKLIYHYSGIKKFGTPDHFPDFPLLIVGCLDQQFKFKISDPDITIQISQNVLIPPGNTSALVDIGMRNEELDNMGTSQDEELLGLPAETRAPCPRTWNPPAPPRPGWRACTATSERLS